MIDGGGWTIRLEWGEFITEGNPPMIQDLIFWQGVLELVLIPSRMAPESLETMISYSKLGRNVGLVECGEKGQKADRGEHGFIM